MEKEPYRPGLGANQGLVQQLKEFQRNPRSLVFVALAEGYRAEGLPNQALDILSEGLSFHPGLASAVVSKARCLFDLRRYAEALAEVQLALTNNPENLKAHKLQAEIYLRLGQRKAALRALTKVVSLYPQDREAVRAMEELENLESRQQIPLARLSRASVDSPPPSTGRIEDFQVGSVSRSFPAPEAGRGRAAGLPDRVILGRREQEEELEEPAPAVSEAESEEEPAFATRTIAELYLRQGLKAKAIRVLRKLTKDDPANEWARETLQDLTADGILLPAPKAKVKRSESLERRARALEKLLARLSLMKPLGA